MTYWTPAVTLEVDCDNYLWTDPDLLAIYQQLSWDYPR